MSEITELGSSEANPLPLRTVISALPPREEIWIQRQTPFAIPETDYDFHNDTIVKCRTPVCVSRPGAANILAALDPQFESGWNKLPTELKVEVLSWLLILGWGKPVDIVSTTAPHANQEALLHFLSTIPEIFSLAHEIFYTRNTEGWCSGRCTWLSYCPYNRIVGSNPTPFTPLPLFLRVCSQPAVKC
jgi:hypothetical protein